MEAIAEAEAIIIGPGSVFTSVLPNLLVDGIRRAIEMSKGLKLYVCNVATERGETDTFAVSDHSHAVYQHIHRQLFHYVVANNNIPSNGRTETLQVEPVRIDGERVDGAAIVASDVVSEDNRYHHDARKLAAALMDLYYQRRPAEQLAPPVAQAQPQEAAVR